MAQIFMGYSVVLGCFGDGGLLYWATRLTNVVVYGVGVYVLEA